MDERSGRRLAWSTAIFSLATGVSRILGLVREIVAAYYFGAAGKINAFTVAFQVPNLFRSLVADQALSAAFVPVFSELLEKGDRIETEHRELVRWIDRAAARGALHRNTAARRKAHAARILAGKR